MIGLRLNNSIVHIHIMHLPEKISYFNSTSPNVYVRVKCANGVFKKKNGRYNEVLTIAARKPLSVGRIQQNKCER